MFTELVQSLPVQPCTNRKKSSIKRLRITKKVENKLDELKAKFGCKTGVENFKIPPT